MLLLMLSKWKVAVIDTVTITSLHSHIYHNYLLRIMFQDLPLLSTDGSICLNVFLDSYFHNKHWQYSSHQ